MSDTGRPERLGDHSPSAKLVYKIIEHDVPLTQSELADEAFLSPRTVRRVARELKQDGLLESHHSQTDGREVVYQAQLIRFARAKRLCAAATSVGL